MRGLRSGRVHTSFRRGAIGLVSAILITPLLGITAAHAENYQFWGYYNWSKDSWELAQTGPADVTPKDGEVTGWRFAIGMDEPRPPRAPGDFETICGQTPEESGQKRVAVVLDYGLAEEAPGKDEAPQPRGACAVVPSQASSEQVLSEVAEVRADNGLTCGIDGYPSRGCGDPVDAPADVELPEPAVELQLPEADGSDDSSGDQQDGSADSEAGSEQSENADSDSAAQRADEQQSGPGVWAVVAIALIVLIAAGALVARLRGRNKAA